MSNKKVLALHFRDSLFATPTEPLFIDAPALKGRIKTVCFVIGIVALTAISLSLS